MAEPLKDQFGPEIVALLAERFCAAHPPFDAAGFTARLVEAFDELELKARINLVADELGGELPDDYPTALAIVVSVAESGVEGFAAWPLCSFVERHGLDHPELSLETMERLTRHWSCEFAVRPYLEDHLDLTRSYLRRWARHEHEDVRRLASEGTRPRLPWGPKVQALVDDPGIGIELLEVLRHDPSETVRRSVANHLNDVARTAPGRVVEITRRWSAESPAADPRMIRHALRGLVKRGDPGALGVLGYTTDPSVSVDAFTVTPATIRLGSAIELEATLTSTASEEQRLVVDFVVHHVGADGTTSPKVFKWTTVSMPPGDTVTITKRRRLQTASTRRYHAGVHRVDLQVGGTTAATTSFDLLDGSD